MSFTRGLLRLMQQVLRRLGEAQEECVWKSKAEPTRRAPHRFTCAGLQEPVMEKFQEMKPQTAAVALFVLDARD